MTPAELFDQWRPLALACARKLYSLPRYRFFAAARGFDEDDFRQAALLATWKVAHVFDPASGYSFGTFVGHAVPRELCRTLRMDRPQLPVSFAGDATEWIADSEAEAVPEAVHRRDMAHTLRGHVDRLPDAWREAMLCYAEGGSFTELAAAEGVTSATVSMRFRRGCSRVYRNWRMG